MPRIAHSKRPVKLRRKYYRDLLRQSYRELKEKDIRVRDIEKLVGLKIGTVTSILIEKAKVDVPTILLFDLINRRPSTIREIELLLNGMSPEEIAIQMVHEA